MSSNEVYQVYGDESIACTVCEKVYASLLRTKLLGGTRYMRILFSPKGKNKTTN